MPKCVECGESVSSLYTNYGKGHIVLTQCSKCGKFVDKYIEYDNVVIFIDMILHKPQVYRHLLFNVFQTLEKKPKDDVEASSSQKLALSMALKSFIRRIKRRFVRLSEGGLLPWTVIKLYLLLIPFEVYIKWIKLDEQQSSIAMQSPALFIHQYAYLCSLSFLEFALFQFVVRLMAILVLGWKMVELRIDTIIAGLIFSSFAKVLHIVMVIWDYNGLEFEYLINLVTFTSNMEAISVIFAIDYIKATIILGGALVGKYALGSVLHYLDPSYPVRLF